MLNPSLSLPPAQREERRQLDPRFVSLLTKSTYAMILAGGRGSRLSALTRWRAKPAVPFGGQFRIIDFTLSNCVNSDIRHIGIATQYKSHSLIQHLREGWSFLDGRLNEFIELLPAQQQIGDSWYKGTTDAVLQNLDTIERNRPDYVLILSADHIYKMDYGKMLLRHVQSGAQMTVACHEVALEKACAFGVICADNNGRVLGFHEKPAVPPPLPGHPDCALVSMGVYVFNTEFLFSQIIHDAHEADSSHDFGKDLIPHLVNGGYRVFAHRFADSCIHSNATPYWRDVGTVDSYWEANIDLTSVTPELNLYDKSWPIWTHQPQLPPAKFVFDDDGRRGMALDSLVSSGCIVSGGEVHRSLLFSNVCVHSYACVEDSVILPDVDIGRHAVIRRAVIDKGCRIPERFQVGIDPESDRRRFHVTEKGVTLITPEMLSQDTHRACQ